MIHDRIAKIEATLAAAPDLPEATRTELLALLADLKTEVATFTEAQGDQASSIARSTDAAITLAPARTRLPLRTCSTISGRRWKASRLRIPGSSKWWTASRSRCRTWGSRPCSALSMKVAGCDG